MCVCVCVSNISHKSHLVLHHTKSFYRNNLFKISLLDYTFFIFLKCMSNFVLIKFYLRFD